MQEDVRVADHAIREEATVRRDLVPLLADLENALVVLGPLMIPELASLRDRRSDIPGLKVPEGSDVPSVLRVLVAQQPRSPTGVVAFPTLAFRDRRHVDHGTFAAEFGDGDVGAEELLRVFDPVLDRTAAHPVLHEVRFLLRDSGQEPRLRVRDETDVIHLGGVDFLPSLSDVVVLRNREDATEFLVELQAPDLPDRLQALRSAAVHAHRGHMHRRDFEDGDGDLYLLARGRGRRPIVDDDRVGHARLVPRKTLDLRTPAIRIRPAREVRNRAFAALAGRKAHRAVSRSVFLRHWPLLRGKWSLVAYNEARANATPP